jgi:hypothetical protein
MFDWLFNLVKRKLGHWLLKDEEADERRRDEELARKRKEILDAGSTVDDTAGDLDRGEF